jgi:hypothetical protein
MSALITPYVTDPDNDFLIVNGDGETVANCWTRPYGMAQACENARTFVEVLNIHNDLVYALEDFGKHKRGCITEASPDSATANNACDCGLSQILWLCEQIAERG